MVLEHKSTPPQFWNSKFFGGFFEKFHGARCGGAVWAYCDTSILLLIVTTVPRQSLPFSFQ